MAGIPLQINAMPNNLQLSTEIYRNIFLEFVMRGSGVQISSAAPFYYIKNLSLIFKNLAIKPFKFKIDYFEKTKFFYNIDLFTRCFQHIAEERGLGAKVATWRLSD